MASASSRTLAPNRRVRPSCCTGPWPAQPSTMSPSTAPASTEASWWASPTSTSRACGRIASSSREASVSDIIEVSSTTTTSYGSGLDRLCRNRVELSGRHPSSRCSVPASRARMRSRRSTAASSAPSPPGNSGRFVAARSAWPMRAAAFPVGAASATRSGWSPSSDISTPSSRAIVVVLPVPGPPVTTLVQRRQATSAASRWSADASSGKYAARAATRAASSTGGAATSRAVRSSTTCVSSCQ